MPLLSTTWTAGSTAGPANVTVNWQDNGVAKTQTFNYTISTTASGVTCSPASGTISSGSLVNCHFTTGSAYTGGSLNWTAGGLTPASVPGNSNPVFTAGSTAGPGNITANWQDNGVAQSQTFNYTISTTASSVTCSPPTGSTIAAGAQVNCTFTLGTAYNGSSLSWTASGLAPATVGVNTNPTFTAGNTAGPGNVTANWQDGGVAKSQTFNYTISTTASSVNCNPGGGTVADGQVVNCSFAPARGMSASLAWTSSQFSPATSAAAFPAFTAGNTSGPASITATWTDGTGNHSQTFSYTISTTASTIVCNPPNGASLTAGDQVNCTFIAGAGYGANLAWTATNFTPTSSGSGTPVFTAGNVNATGTIGATWTDGAGSHSALFSYTITKLSSAVTCNPPNGTIAVGSVVNCSFTPGTGYGGNISWTSTGFSPSGPVTTVSAPFTAGGTAGAAQINATWSDSAGNHSVSFNYTISASLSSVTCSPPSGTIAAGQVVPCAFTAGDSAAGLAWSVPGFVAGPSGFNPSFTAGSTAGPASITASWTDGGTNHSQTFSYTISTTASVVNCNPANGTIAVSSVVNCSFVPGTGYSVPVAWSSVDFNPASSVFQNPSFTAQGTAGAASITATWADASGAHSVTFGYTVSASLSSVTCSPPSGTIAAGQVVPCAFTAGDASSGPTWAVAGFPAGPSGNNPSFTAGNTAGPASITASWTDGGTNHSQTFSYTISTTASLANCVPPSGNVATGAVVNCTFTPGTGYGGNIPWSQTGFTGPATTGTNSPSFTAGSVAGPAVLTATWSDAAGAHSQSFNYVINTSSSAVTCNPPNGTIAVGSVVNCSFTPGTGYGGNISWTSTGFSPSGPVTTVSAPFTAGGTAGAAQINATWSDSAGNHSVSFNYTISASLSSVTCSPPSGTIAAGQVVPCAFTAGDSAAGLAWSVPGFVAGPSGFNPSFTAGSTAGPASITASWTDGGTNHSQTFSYTISTTASVVNCNPANGTIAVSSVVNCSFVPGTGYSVPVAWSSVDFNPASSVFQNPSFTAQGTAGAASITATWADASGAHSVTFGYTVSASLSSVTCSPPSGTIAAGQVVPCAFTAGDASSGPTWAVAGFPAGPSGNNPSFTAGNTAGPASITASWTDGGTNHSQTFSYTISTTASLANCVPPSGNVATGAVVNCTFTPGTGYGGNILWSQTGFTGPATTTTNSPSFTAGSVAGPAVLTATWSDAAGAHSQSFNYVIVVIGSSADCNPPSGTIASSSVVNCSFSLGHRPHGRPGWTATGFSSLGGGNSPSFQAGTAAGPATISVTWTDSTGSHSKGFNYVISITDSSVACSPPSGSTIGAGTTVNCTFAPGTGLSSGPTWTASGFAANGGGNNPSFLAGSTAGPATITASWSDSNGSHSQGFNYTISTTGLVGQLQPVRRRRRRRPGRQLLLQRRPGLRDPGVDHEPLHRPGRGFAPAFSANTVAGPASITATWTDGQGNHSQSFNYTISTTASTVVCNPASFSTIAASSTVQCQFNAGAGYSGGSLAWTASNFTPVNSPISPVTFTASASGGTGTIQATWTDGSGFHSQTFTYTISTTASLASCNPAGGPVATNQVVNCSFNAGSGYVALSLNWSTAGFAPGSSASVVPSFTAGTIGGPASITATWNDGSGVHSQSFNYTISTTVSAATCNPGSGTIPASSVINCSFTASVGYTPGSLVWTLSSGLSFDPNSTSTSIAPVVLAGTTLGPVHITANWSDSSGNRSQGFNYTIGTTPSLVNCSPANGNIAPASIVNCLFTPGSGYAGNLGWTSSNFTPATINALESGVHRRHNRRGGHDHRIVE